MLKTAVKLMYAVKAAGKNNFLVKRYPESIVIRV